MGKEPAGERANGVLLGFALPADAVLESVLEAVLRCHMRVDARPMLGSRDAEAGQAGRPGVFVQLLDDVKDQGIGLLHVISCFLQHALDYNMPAGFCRLRLAGPAHSHVGAHGGAPNPEGGRPSAPTRSVPSAPSEFSFLTFCLAGCLTGYDGQATGQFGQISLRYGQRRGLDCCRRRHGRWTGRSRQCIIRAGRNDCVICDCLLA